MKKAYHFFILLLLFSNVLLSSEVERADDTRADSAFQVFKSALIVDDYATATDAVDTLLSIRLRQSNRYEWVRAMSFKAELFRSMVALNLAIEVINEAEPYAKKLEPSTVQSVFYNRKAAILYELKQQDAALEAVK